ncbi:transcription factor MYB1R1-like [Coffea arabica]|uniref:Transcription factor MYB1R1-like n=1 Tax=Coffea arabica TaxID=13443 RepID=A0ABM4W5L5_COFAR|nr:transcription factor MYB1R1 [Coffea arabica]
MASSCSLQCGNDGQNCCQTCPEVSGAGPAAAAAADGCNKGFMLFGVRVMEGSFRKSASMNNLAQFEQPQDSMNNNDVNAGYASDDVVHPSARNRERKRGVPWTEDEHRLFLLGLQKVGKGDWRGISRNFVKTRTPTQVASHAQKYFLRRNNHSRRRRRSSLFDITTDTVLGSAMEDRAQEESVPQPAMQQQKNLINNLEKFPMSTYPTNIAPVMLPVNPVKGVSSLESLTLGPANNQLLLNRTNNTSSPTPKLIRPIPLAPIPPSSKMADLNLNKTTIPDPLPLSLKLSTPSSSAASQPSSEQHSPSSSSPPARHTSPFQAMPSSFDNSSGDSIISVA